LSRVAFTKSAPAGVADVPKRSGALRLAWLFRRFLPWSPSCRSKLSRCRKSLAAGLTIIALAAGCGGEKHAQSIPSTTSPTTTSPNVRALIHDYKILGADVRALRAAAAKVDKGTLLGTPELRRLNSRFIEDLESSHLSPKARNREIDHAAAAVATSCEQCFQQLEAIRPIPQIAGH
jgi:hypothetical protein